MKQGCLLAIVLVALSGNVSYAQGVVNFANATTALPSPPDRLVRFQGAGSAGVPDGTPFSTNASPTFDLSGYRAQLFYGATPNPGSMVAVTAAPASFRASTSANVGAWFGGLRTLEGFGNGANVYLQVRVWDYNLSPTWPPLNFYFGLGYGESAVFSFTTPQIGAPGTDALMQNFQGFNVVFMPEPNAVALFGLAAICVLFGRRRTALL